MSTLYNRRRGAKAHEHRRQSNRPRPVAVPAGSLQPTSTEPAAGLDSTSGKQSVAPVEFAALETTSSSGEATPSDLSTMS